MGLREIGVSVWLCVCVGEGGLGEGSRLRIEDEGSSEDPVLTSDFSDPSEESFPT